jgi:hypothetical protein
MDFRNGTGVVIDSITHGPSSNQRSNTRHQQANTSSLVMALCHLTSRDKSSDNSQLSPRNLSTIVLAPRVLLSGDVDVEELAVLCLA